MLELIQNAEDNQYDAARRADREPFLRFDVTSERIVIELNEDGFSKKDVETICKVAKSNKSGVRRYIGEKGIGFKSVFTVSSRVQVQSGPFAFHFNYRGGKGDGMGMVTPYESEHEELPHNVRTRFTLTLKKNIDYGSLLQEFAELPDTLLLFLTKLKRLQLSVRDGNFLHESRYEYLYHERTKQAVIVKYKGREEDKRLRFFIRQKTIHELPFETERENIDAAEVVLAFPVDSSESPIIEPQHVCAFLPMKKIDLPVSIHPP